MHVVERDASVVDSCGNTAAVIARIDADRIQADAVIGKNLVQSPPVGGALDPVRDGNPTYMTLPR